MAQLVAIAAINALVSVGVGLISRALSPRSSTAAAQGTAAPTQVDILAQNPEPGAGHPGLFGHRRVGGPIVFTGKSNGKTYIVIEIAGAPVAAINAVFINNAPASIDGSGNVLDTPWYDGSGHYSLNIKVYDGTQTTVDSAMTAAFPNWTSQFVGKQIAYARIVIDTTGNSSFFANSYKAGVPDFTFDVSGFACYDPRDGTQVLATPSTWKYTNNAALINANYLVHVLGMNLPTSYVDWTSVGAAADICDQTVSLASGGTEQRYTASLAWNTKERHEVVLDRIGLAHAGGAYFVGTKYLVRSGAWRASSAMITPDVYAPGDQTVLQFSDTQPIANLCNGVRGNFTSPMHNWEARDYPYFKDAAAISADGANYWLDLNFDAVTSPTQAQRLAKIAYMVARYGFPAAVDLQFSQFNITAEDVVTINDALAGFSGTTFRVLDDRLDGNFLLHLQLQYEDSTFYDWTAASEEQSFAAVAPVLGEGANVGIPGAVVYDNAAGTTVDLTADFTLPVSGNAVNVKYSLSWTGFGVVATGTVTAAGLSTVHIYTYGSGAGFTSGSLDVWSEDQNGASSVVGSVALTATSMNGLTNSTTTFYSLPTPARPWVVSGTNGANTFYLSPVTSGKATHIELWENTTNNSGTASLVGTVTNAGGSVTLSRTPGATRWYWARTKNATDSKYSGFSNVQFAVY